MMSTGAWIWKGPGTPGKGFEPCSQSEFTINVCEWLDPSWLWSWAEGKWKVKSQNHWARRSSRAQRAQPDGSWYTSDSRPVRPAPPSKALPPSYLSPTEPAASSRWELDLQREGETAPLLKLDSIQKIPFPFSKIQKCTQGLKANRVTQGGAKPEANWAARNWYNLGTDSSLASEEKEKNMLSKYSSSRAWYACL